MPNEYKLPLSGPASSLGPRSSPSPPPQAAPEDEIPEDTTSGSSNPLSMIRDTVSGVSDALGNSGVAAWEAAKQRTGVYLAATQQAPQNELVQYFVNMGINPATAVQLSQKISTMERPAPPLANGVKIRMSSWPGDGPEQGGSMTDYVKAAGSAIGTDTAAKPGLAGLSKVFTVDEWNSLPDTTKRDLIRGAADKPKDPPDGPGFSGIIKPINPSKT